MAKQEYAPRPTPRTWRVAPEVGFEPTTNRLTADRSTTELLWIAGAYISCIDSLEATANRLIPTAAGNFYIGHTDNLENRILNHNRTDKIAGKFTRKNGPWALVWSEEHPNRSSAMRREREIKNWKSARLIRDRLVNKKA